MAGLVYPAHDLVTQIAQQGNFIYVDRTAPAVSLIRGADMRVCLQINPHLLFVIPMAIVGTEADIRSSLTQAGYSGPEIDSFLTETINIHNISIADSFIQHYQQLADQSQIQTQTSTPIPSTSTQSTQTPTPAQSTSNPIPTSHSPSFPGFTYPVTVGYTPEFISERRQWIHDTVVMDYLGGVSNFTALPPILGVLFDLYNQAFFQSQLTTILQGKTFRIEYSRMTSTGGSCSLRGGCEVTIKIGGPVILGTFTQKETFHLSNGLQCTDRLYCLMNVLEHELIHLIIQNTVKHRKTDPIYKSHGLFFQQLAQAYFGHTGFKHSLKSSKSVYLTREDFQVGETVAFQAKDQRIVGTIMQLNPKTARVGSYKVPYSLLEKSVERPTIATKTRTDFQVGNTVMFTTKNGPIHGTIIKLNPTKARVVSGTHRGHFDVGYGLLTRT